MHIRSIKTKTRIKLAIFQLLKEKKLEKITITEACNMLNMCRCTFYYHFQNISSILNEMYDEVFQHLNLLCETLIMNKDNNISSLFKTINNFIIENSIYLNTLSQTSYYSELASKVNQYLYETIFDPKKQIKKNNCIKNYLIILGIVSLYSNYIINYEKNKETSLIEISSVCEDIIIKNLF